MLAKRIHPNLTTPPATHCPTSTTMAQGAASAVYCTLGSRPGGLTTVEANQRLQTLGPNQLVQVKGQPLYRKFFGNFTHLMAILLWVAGAAAMVAQLPQLAVAIWLVNLINGAFSFWQEYKAEQATAALRRLLPTYARVLRNGVEQRIPAAELIPGDVMLLAEGDHVSADGRLVQEAELQLDQSTLTGESRPVRKSADAVVDNGLTTAELPNLVFAGTNVVAGTGIAVVYATGMATEFGRIAHLTQSIGNELSPLQREISVVTKVVTVIAVGIGLIFFALAVILGGMDLAAGFIFGVGLIVAFVPEGLLPTVTLALAMGVQRMARRHALIKRLSAVETLGCTTVILSDKTGTLTQNEMTVNQLWAAGRHYTVSGVGYEPVGLISDTAKPGKPSNDPALRQLLLAAGLCNNARLLAPTPESPRWTVLGDPTEAALSVAAAKAGLDLEAESQATPRLRELPFDSHRKRMTTIHQQGDSRTAYVKGAPKEVLALCTQLALDGEVQPLTEETRQEVAEVNDSYARAGLRVLSIAMRKLPADRVELTAEGVERTLTLLGLAAMVDPPRPEVAAAVEKCHRAGIRIIMITGDYGLTAESIARRIGIVRSAQPSIVTGGELEKLDDAALAATLSQEVIFARVSPEHKLRVVQALQRLGHVVAVTGDGVNDAPALKQADIGVAMGLVGTDVAKEAADMILTDDNFASIVGAVEEGRAVYANIKKFTAYIFTSNTPEAVPFIAFAFSGGRIPLALNIMQILAVDLGTDLAPALALGAEPPEPGIMDRPPRRLEEHVITPGLLARAYLWLGPLQSAVAMAAFYAMYWTNGYWGQWQNLPASGVLYAAATTMTLAAVVATQIGNLLAQRTEQSSLVKIGLFSNRLIWLGIGIELIVIVLLVYVPLLQNIFGTARLTTADWLFVLAWAPLLLIADEARKFWLRRWQCRSKGGQP